MILENKLHHLVQRSTRIALALVSGLICLAVYAGGILVEEASEGTTHVVTGRVVDDEGAPVARASIRWGDVTVESNAEGEFTITGIPRGVSTIRVSHSLYAPTEETILIPVEEPLVVEMRSGGSVEGQVRSLDELAIEGLKLTIDTTDGETRTGADGSYRFEHIPSGTAWVRLVLPEDSGYQERRINVFDGESSTLDFALGTLRGRLSRGIAPVAGAVVTLTHDKWSAGETQTYATSSGITDVDGAYVLRGVGPGDSKVLISFDDWTLKSAVVVPHDLVLDLAIPERTLKGQVFDRKRQDPLVGARIGLEMPNRARVPAAREDGGQYLIRTKTREGGTFSLPVGIADSAALTVFMPGYKYAKLDIDGGKTNLIKIELDRLVEVTVRVLTEAGIPVERHMICVTDHCDSGSGGELETAVAEGDHRVLVSSPGLATKVIQWRAEDSGDGIPIELSVKLMPGGQLRVRVPRSAETTPEIVSLIDPSGLDCVELMLFEPPSESVAYLTWSSQPLQPGTWRVGVNLGGAEPVWKEVEISGRQVTEVSFP